MVAFNVLETQFQMFITSRLYLDDEYVAMIRSYFIQYTQQAIPEFCDTLIQHLESVKKSIDERTQHKRKYDSWVNERQMQTIEEKVDMSKPLDASLVDTESSGTESKEQDTSSKSGNDAHTDDADIRPIYDEEPMAEERKVASAKPHHKIASSNSRNSSKNMSRFSPNDMVHNHYLEEAKKKTQERRNGGAKSGEGRGLRKRVVLPTSFTTGPRYMMQNYQDAMDLCRAYGNPDLFITFTSKTKWLEISEMMAFVPGQISHDRQEVGTQFFKMKLTDMLDDLKKCCYKCGKKTRKLYQMIFSIKSVNFSGDQKDILIQNYNLMIEIKKNDCTCSCILGKSEDEYLKERAILAPWNDDADAINAYMFKMLPCEFVTYNSADKVCKASTETLDQEHLYLIEFLNSLNFQGKKPHAMNLKKELPIMLLRNVNPIQGLCNGTRLIITDLGQFVIRAKILTGLNMGETVLILRITLTSTQTQWPS
nr:ATP-dependent DNA helicase PIF1-like [Tanacetum cinerariifolium]